MIKLEILEQDGTAVSTTEWPDDEARKLYAFRMRWVKYSDRWARISYPDGRIVTSDNAPEGQAVTGHYEIFTYRADGDYSQAEPVKVFTTKASPSRVYEWRLNNRLGGNGELVTRWEMGTPEDAHYRRLANRYDADGSHGLRQAVISEPAPRAVVEHTARNHVLTQAKRHGWTINDAGPLVEFMHQRSEAMVITFSAAGAVTTITQGRSYVGQATKGKEETALKMLADVTEAEPITPEELSEAARREAPFTTRSGRTGRLTGYYAQGDAERPYVRFSDGSEYAIPRQNIVSVGPAAQPQPEVTEPEEDPRGKFTPGQAVEVWRDEVYQYTGTVVGYIRCGNFRVREPDFDTVCDYDHTELRPVVPPEIITRDGVTYLVDEGIETPLTEGTRVASSVRGWGTLTANEAPEGYLSVLWDGADYPITIAPGNLAAARRPVVDQPRKAEAREYQGAPARLVYRGLDRDGTAGGGVVVGLEIPSPAGLAKRLYDQRWRSATITRDGIQVGWVGPHPDTGRRTWSGEDQPQDEG